MCLLSTGSAFQWVKDNIIAFAYCTNQVINYLRLGCSSTCTRSKLQFKRISCFYPKKLQCWGCRRIPEGKSDIFALYRSNPLSSDELLSVIAVILFIA